MSVGRFHIYRIRFAMLAGLLLASIFLATSLFPESVASGQTSYISTTAVMQQLVKDTNTLRIQKGLLPLISSKSLENSAKAKLYDMRINDYWGHYAPNGTSFSSFIWEENATASSVGENLARCFDTYDAAFTGLVQSPKHFAVLTGDFTYVGVASEITADGCESIVMHVSN